MTSDKLEVQKHPPVVDLSKYAQRILANEDRPLFDDAVKAASVGALRAAYIMIWLACAESLKRRFWDAQVRDNKAGTIVGKISELEDEQRAVDRYLLDQAKEYGFLTSPDHTLLVKVYEMRSVYGHPYQQAPSEEQLVAAAADVVDLVLSKPVKLRHGFGQQILQSLLNDRHYLDDYRPKVEESAKSVIAKLDEGILVWLLDKYWHELEKLSNDPSAVLFFNRGVWFSRAILREYGVLNIDHDGWHDRTRRFPKTLMHVCGEVEVFGDIGGEAQDSLVGSVLEEAEVSPGVLTVLETLAIAGALSDRQQQRFSDFVSESQINTILKSGLRTKTCFARLIGALSSSTYSVQNDAVRLVTTNGSEQISELADEQKVELGRSIRLAAEVNAWDALTFIGDIGSAPAQWPFSLIRGIVFQSFVGNDNELRLRVHSWNHVYSLLVALEPVTRAALIAELVDVINAAERSYLVSSDSLRTITESLNPNPWSQPLMGILNGLK